MSDGSAVVCVDRRGYPVRVVDEVEDAEAAVRSDEKDDRDIKNYVDGVPCEVGL